MVDCCILLLILVSRGLWCVHCLHVVHVSQPQPGVSRSTLSDGMF